MHFVRQNFQRDGHDGVHDGGRISAAQAGTHHGGRQEESHQSDSVLHSPLQYYQGILHPLQQTAAGADVNGAACCGAGAGDQHAPCSGRLSASAEGREAGLPVRDGLLQCGLHRKCCGAGRVWRHGASDRLHLPHSASHRDVDGGDLLLHGGRQRVEEHEEGAPASLYDRGLYRDGAVSHAGAASGGDQPLALDSERILHRAYHGLHRDHTLRRPSPGAGEFGSDLFCRDQAGRDSGADVGHVPDDPRGQYHHRRLHAAGGDAGGQHDLYSRGAVRCG